MKAMIWNLRRWISETDTNALTAAFDRMVLDAGFTVLDTMEHHFQPQGFTKLYLLAESHLAIHTFPEEGKTYIELSSCNERMQRAFEALFAKAYGNAKAV